MSTQKHYSDWFQPKKTYKPVMTREAINETPDTWLSFYPHPSFVRILRELLGRLESGDRSVWITGTYGSGKSHAALVIHKLLMDEESRVEAWLADNAKLVPAEVAQGIRDARTKRTLAVYDTGTDDVRTPRQLVWRIEKAVLDAARKAGWKVPAITGAEELLQRIERDEKVFFSIRDEMQGELTNLTPDITSAKELRARATKKDGTFAAGLLQDAESVLERDNVFLSTSANRLLDWIKELREANGGGKIVFLWDEFSSYIDHAKGDLKTFEELSEPKAQQCGFHFVPITHMGLNAFFADGSGNAKKAETRYAPLAIEIPAGHVFHLGEKAFIHKNEAEWESVRDNQLWSEVSQMVAAYMMPKLAEGTVEKAEDFRCILPLHPMSAILLMKLSEKVGQNVRSFFDYLRASGEESEFERFLKEGGPDVEGRQLLSADYLWRYFVETQSVSPDPAAMEIGADFHSKKKAFGWPDGCAEERVYKAALLYTLLDRKSAGSDLTAPTVDNLVRAFQGDGAVSNVKGVVDALEKDRHCFAVVNGHIQRFQLGDEKGLEDEKAQWRGKFSLVTEQTEKELQKIVNQYGDQQRYVVRAFDAATFKRASLARLGDFGDGAPPSGNKIAVLALFAKDHDGKLALAEKAREAARMFSGLRVCVVFCDDLSFCDKRESRWEDFVALKARHELASDETTRSSFQKQMDDEIADWVKSVRAPETTLTLVVPDDHGGEPFVHPGLGWKTLKPKLLEAKGHWLPESPDEFAQGFTNVMNPLLSAAARWAEAGLTGTAAAQYQGMVQRFKAQKIDWSDGWRDANPNHPLSKMRDFFEKKIRNAIGNGTPCSVRKAYLELQRAPWGLEKNAFSAFVLGFALKPWLDKGLQWTDGVNTQALDAPTLAEIIARVVENDGTGEIKGEKQVCRLSKEEKLFTKHVAELFHVPVDATATPEQLLGSLCDSIGKSTGNVPLWMLPAFVRSLGTEVAEEAICDIVANLCEALRISSKSKDGTRLERIKKVGAALDPDANPGVKEALARYLEPETFVKAFDLWLSAKAATAKSLSAEIGDSTGVRLREAVASRFAQEASWLWNEQDATGALAEIEARWRFLREVRKLHGPYGGWIDYAEARETIRRAVLEENRVSIDALARKWPFVGKLAAFVRADNPTTENVLETARLLADEEAGYRELFRDASRAAVLARLASIFDDAEEAKGLQASDWRSIHDGIAKGGATLDESTFRETVWPLVLKRANDSFRGQLAAAWKKATGFDSPEAWCEAKVRPVETLFPNRVDADAFLLVWKNPTAATEAERTEALKALAGLPAPTDAAIDARFLERYLPKRFSKMGIPAAALAEWFAEDLGHPDGWRDHENREDVTAQFVLGSYEEEYLPKAKERVSKMNGDEAREKLLSLVENLPEAGIAMLG